MYLHGGKQRMSINNTNNNMKDTKKNSYSINYVHDNLI